MTALIDPWSFDYPERLEVARDAILRADFPAALKAIEGVREEARVAHEIPVIGGRIEAPRNGATNTARDLHSNRHYTEGGADPMMVAPKDAVHPQCRDRHAEDAETIRRLRTDLERAIRQRDALTPRAVHWFVDDGNGTCLACNLPAKNARHALRGDAD